jgi:hypothetical protein
METPILDAISVLYSWAEGYVTHLDMRLSEEDDGEKHSVKEAKEEFDRQISNMIEDLQRLKVKAQNTAFKKFISEEL